MTIVACEKCGAKNRVDERVTVVGKEPVCGRCGAKLRAEGGGARESAESHPKTVSDSTFQRDVVEASNTMPVLVDFWASWCGPCRMIAPALDELAGESGGRYRIAKLNVDDNPVTAQAHGVRSIPTLFIYKNGQQVERITGAQPKQVLASRLNAHL